MFRVKFLLLAVGCLLLSVTVAVLLFTASPKSVKAQSLAAPENASDAFDVEYEFQNGICLTEEKRAELQEQVQSSINKLRGEGKLAAIGSSAPPKFIFPVRGNGAGEKDYGTHVIPNFVDHNPAFPNQLRDYNCGTRTYDTETGYNHKGTDISNFPFAWNKMDNNETVAVAAAAGQIIFKQDGYFDRSCTWNTTTTWNIVSLRHSDGTVSHYGHLKLNSLTTKAVGETVTQGEFLGVIGSSGVSQGPHLHFEVYNPDNKLQDPYQGPCNLMNNFSYWLVQPAYRDSSINKLMTHSALPVSQPCPNPTITNEKNVFAPGSQIILAAYYRDRVAGQVSQFSLIQPDGTVYESWTQVSPGTSNGASASFTRNLPVNAMTGVWKFRVVYESKTYEHTFLVRSTPFDFDGDSKSDVSVFRPENGAWYLNQSANGFTGVSFGQNGDKIVPADYDGDGKTDVAVFRNGTWYLNRSQLGFIGIAFGEATDIPVPEDYDGDGKADIAVFRPSTGVWYLNRSTLGFTGIAFGQAGDKPVAADYDGDGKADIAVYRNGTWYLQRSKDGFTGVAFGEAADKPVPADYDGDGKTDIAVFRPSNGTWYLLRTRDGFTGIQFGLGTDKPVPADYDGDGKADLAVYRDGTWYIQRSQLGFTGVAFGAATDKPAPNAFIP
ncbi:MAG: VCBS repeat domain-containing M23 family metallopeptidase [Acidobacteria bacterium]|nr:VCBS repeat domain-containing M23 family metallopeptidase [Acidobacteriota bacterium]MCA1639390.1 VCBS repeat domain-containing M23 family metallopeptidase [Acidobacteriota bacterium]